MSEIGKDAPGVNQCVPAVNTPTNGPTYSTTKRAEIVRVGGAVECEISLRFSSGEIVHASCGDNIVKRAAAYLHNWVSVTIRLQRNASGEIIFASVIDIKPLSKESPIKRLSDWYIDAGAPTIEDVIRERTALH